MFFSRKDIPTQNANRLSILLDKIKVQLDKNIDIQQMVSWCGHFCQSQQHQPSFFAAIFMQLASTKSQHQLIKNYSEICNQPLAKALEKLTINFAWYSAELLVSIERAPEVKFAEYLRLGENQRRPVSKEEDMLLSELHQSGVLTLTFEQFTNPNAQQQQQLYQTINFLLALLHQSNLAMTYKASSIIANTILILAPIPQLPLVETVNLITQYITASRGYGKYQHILDMLNDKIDGEMLITDAVANYLTNNNEEYAQALNFFSEMMLVFLDLDMVEQDVDCYIENIRALNSKLQPDNSAEQLTIQSKYFIVLARLCLGKSDVESAIHCLQQVTNFESTLNNNNEPSLLPLYKNYLTAKYLQSSILIETENWYHITRIINFCQFDTQLLTRPELQHEAARYHACYGLWFIRNNDLSIENKQLHQANQILQQLSNNYPNHPEIKLDHIKQLTNGAQELKVKQNYQQAITQYQQAEKLLEYFYQKELMLAQVFYFNLLIKSNLSIIYRHAKQLGSALKAAKESIALAKQLPDTPQRAIRLSASYHALALIYFDLTQYQSCYATIEHALTALDQQQLERSDLDTNKTKIYLLIAKLLNHGYHIDNSKLLNYSEQMCLYIERTNGVDNDKALIISLFYIYHNAWFNREQQQNPNSKTLLTIASIVFGRTLLTKLHDTRLINKTEQSHPALHQQMKQRQAFWQLKEKLETANSDLMDVFKQELRKSLTKGAQADTERFEQARQQTLNDLDSYKTMGRDKTLLKSMYPQYSLSQLQASLKAAEKLIMLLDFNFEVTAIDLQHQANQQYALIIDKHQGIKCQQLNITFNQKNLNDDDLRVENNQVAAKNLWQQLQPHTSQHQLLHLITLGRFHLFPLNSHKPQNSELRFYPSLAFFNENANLQQPTTNHNFLSIRNTDSSLPFAGPESQLLRSIWQNTTANSQRFTDPQSAAAVQILKTLHLSGHGVLQQNRKTGRLESYILTSEENYLSEQYILEHLPPAEVVWLSACSLAQLKENEYGDPNGIIIPFLFNGSHAIVASLVSVEDYWSPLYVGLTEWSRLNLNLTIGQAIELTNQVLADWPHDSRFEPFKAIYTRWIKTLHRQLIEQIWTEMEMPRAIEQTSLKVVANFIANYAEDNQLKMRIDNSGLNQSAQLIEHCVTQLAEQNLTPPKETCESFKDNIRVFYNHTN